MNSGEIHCICPPSPEAEVKLDRGKMHFHEKGLRVQNDDEERDLRSHLLVASRPARTRPDTFVSASREFHQVIGTRKALVLLVDFDGTVATRAAADIEAMMFSAGTYDGEHGAGSMRDFYSEASYGRLDVTGDVSGEDGITPGWYRAAHPKEFYANGTSGITGSALRNPQLLVQEAVNMARPHVNFADYDSDGDGVVDALIIIAAGSGAEATLDPDDLWSHKGGIVPVEINGVTVSHYFLGPEDGKIGVMCHELGHLLFKWPDLYDTDRSSQGTGRWDLMAKGTWNDGGRTPAHPAAWCKVKAGWVVPTTVFNASQTVSIGPSTDSDVIYKLPVNSADSNEYFLLSNRQRRGFDAHIPGDGLIIEHVDDSQMNNSDESHYLVDIVQSDGKRDLNNNQNSGDADDPFPTDASNRFTRESDPSSNAYGGANSHGSVTNIQRSGADIRADVRVGPDILNIWNYRKKVVSVYASHASEWGWAEIETLGWRRINAGTPSMSTNVFYGLCEAEAKGRQVNVNADLDFIYSMNLI